MQMFLEYPVSLRNASEVKWVLTVFHADLHVIQISATNTVYSGANKYLIHCRLVKFSHLQRMERSVIFIVVHVSCERPLNFQNKSWKKIQKIPLYDF